MVELKWADIKLALDARALTLRLVDGEWWVVDKDTGSAPSALPPKIKDLGFGPCKKPKGSPGRGFPEGYNLQEKSSMNDVDYRIQQSDLKLLCHRTHAVDMSKTIMKQQSGAVNLVIRSFLKVHPEYEAWRKYGFWNIRAGIQLILRVSACTSKKLRKSMANSVKPRKKRGKPRAEKAEVPVPTGQPAIVNQSAAAIQVASSVPQGEDENAETIDLDGVASDDDEPEFDDDEEPEFDEDDESGPEDEELLEGGVVEDPGPLDITMANSSWVANLPNQTVDMADAKEDDEEDGGIFDMSQVAGNSTAADKPASATHSIASGLKARSPAPPSAVPATTTKSACTPSPTTGELASRPSVSLPSHRLASGKVATPKSASSEVTRNTPPPAQSASVPLAHATHSSPPATTRTPASGTPTANAASSPSVTPGSAPASTGGPAPPARKSTPASTTVWRGRKISKKQMATIRANAARQAAGDKIRASPIYQDLIDMLAADPDYDPASEPLPPADLPADPPADLPANPPANLPANLPADLPADPPAPLAVREPAVPPKSKPTVPVSTIVWRGMKISKKQLATIQANAARQAAGDKIRASPIYQDLIDIFAADPDYNPASEPLPPADHPADPPAPPRGASRNRNAAPVPGPTTVASAPTDADPPAGKSRARPKPKPKPIPELDIVADDETDSCVDLLNVEGGKAGIDEGCVEASGKGAQDVAGGKGKGVAQGERAPAAARKGKAVAEGEHVGAGTSTAAKNTQGKKATKGTVAKAPATKSSRRK